MRKTLKNLVACVIATHIALFTCCCAPIALRASESPTLDINVLTEDGEKSILPVRMDFRKMKDVPPTAVIEVGRLSQDMGLSVAVTMDMYRQLGSKRIVLLIDSPGGIVSVGHALSEWIEVFELPVTCIVTGEAKSMALYLLQSCDWRVAVPESQISGHEPATMIVQQLLNQYDLKQRAKGLQEISMMMAIYITKRSHITPEIYLDNLLTTGMWDMTAAQAFDLGLLDELVEPKDIPAVSTVIQPNVQKDGVTIH